jgi:hypothetical protein
VNEKTLEAQASGGLFRRGRVKPVTVAERSESGRMLQGRSKPERGAGRRKPARSLCRSKESQCVVAWGLGRDGIAARWRMETLGGGQRRRSQDRETGTDRFVVMPWRRNPRSACGVEQTHKPEAAVDPS